MKSYLPWNKRSNSTGKIVIGTIAGIAAGFTAGILTAPRPGRETRDLLASRADETLEKVKGNLAEGKEKIVEGKEKVVEKVVEKAAEKVK